jgi:hypothetical protein
VSDLLWWVLVHDEVVDRFFLIAFAAGLAAFLIGGLRIAYAKVWDDWTPPAPTVEVIEGDFDEGDGEFFTLIDGWARRDRPYDTSGWLDDQPLEVSQEIPRDGGEGGS